VVYGFGRIDASGRVADRTILGALGWRGGDRLTLTAEAGVMVARRDPGGVVTVPARPHIVIPAALRHRCGLRAGDRVLLAALPGQDTLTAYSFAVAYGSYWNRVLEHWGSRRLDEPSPSEIRLLMAYVKTHA